jgi:hypothetical protein
VKTFVAENSDTRPAAHIREKNQKKLGRASRLQFSADVRVDFAIQANFFKSRCCPLHDCFTSKNLKLYCFQTSMILSREVLQIKIKREDILAGT